MSLKYPALLFCCVLFLVSCATDSGGEDPAEVTEVVSSATSTATQPVPTAAPALDATPVDPYDAAAQEILLEVNKAIGDYYVVEIQTLRADWAISVGRAIEAWHQHAEAWRQLVPPPAKSESHERISARLEELEAIGDEIIATVQSGQQDLSGYYVRLDPIEGQISANIDRSQY